jgi:type IV pilus assembly protein PilC
LEKYKYRAINESGRPIRGVLSAANDSDLYKQLKDAKLELIDCKKIKKSSGVLSISFLQKIRVRDLIQFFVQLQQMQNAGIPLLDSLADIRDTSDNSMFRDIMSEIYRDVSEGSSFSEALSRQPKAFSNLQVSLISAGEENGDIKESCRQLVVYLKWVDRMQTRVRKATRYPTILLIAVVATIVVMMAFVVPQIVGFIESMDQELPFATTSLMATSDFFVEYWLYVLTIPVIVFFALSALRKVSEGFAYQLDSLVLRLPMMGELIRKINIARFSQTFGALFAGGIDVLKALDAASLTVGNRVIKESLNMVEQYVKEGDPFSTALNKSGQFPSMVVRMVRVGEESGNLTVVLDQVAEFYTNDVDEEVEKVIAMIEPSLTAALGVMILWIAVGVFGPVYSSFENLDF